MTIIKAFTVPNEANRKKRETQRKAVLWSRKVFKSLPKAGCIFNAPCIDFAVLRRFTYQGLTRWIITLQTKKRVWQEVHSKCCSTWTVARRETALSPSWDEWQSTGLWRSSVANKVFSDNGRLILTIDLRPIGEWFKEQFEKLQQRIHRPVSPQRKDRGMKL